MNLAVVVVTFNSEACIESCLQAVQRHLPVAELLVVDNASTDATRAIVGTFSGVRLLENPQNDGFGRACNAGARAATSNYLLFLNPDVVLTKWDPRAIEALLESEPFGLIGPEHQHDGGLIGAQSEHRALRDWFELTFGMVRPKEWRPHHRPLKKPGGRIWLSGAMLLVKRSEFLRLGGFDPRFFLYYEDRDLSLRYRSAELPIRESSALSAFHTGTASSVSDDLRIEPLGWAFLGWIEYVYIHKGEKAARQAARWGLLTLRAMTTLLGPARSVPLGRAKRKRRQIRELIRFVERHGAMYSKERLTFCADAGRVLSTVL